MDAALAAVLPQTTWSLRAGSSGTQEPAAGATTTRGNIIGSSSTSMSSLPSLLTPSLRGLVLVSDSLGADAAFVVAHLLLKCLRDGHRRVVLVAAAESGAHYSAVLKKLGLSGVGGGFQRATAAAAAAAGKERLQQQQQQQQQRRDQLITVPLWDDDDLWTRGLERASELIKKAVGEEEANGDAHSGEKDDDDDNPTTTTLVFDSLSALAAAARSEREWENFVAREVLGSRASCVVARTDCLPGDDLGGGRRLGGGDGENDEDGDDGQLFSALSSSAAAAGGASSARAPWLSALRSAANVELTTRPLPSGAAVDVSGVLFARRGATAAAEAPKRRRQRRREQEQQQGEPPPLAPLSLSPTPPPPPPRSTAVFNYRLVDAAVRLVPRRNV